MINFSGLSDKAVVGRVLRSALAIIPDWMTMRVMQGPLKGKKWVKGAGVNGYWLGSYELPEQEEIQKHLHSGDVVFDCGAHTGFYSLMAAELVGAKGVVYSFEPLPRNIEILKKHIKLNNYKNIKVMETAVGEYDGEANFAVGASTFEGRLDNAGSLRVSIARLDTLVARRICPPPNFIKVDIEGKFEALLRGAMETIKSYKPIILFEAHYQTETAVFDLLKRVGYNIKPIDANNFTEANNFIALVQ